MNGCGAKYIPCTHYIGDCDVTVCTKCNTYLETYFFVAYTYIRSDPHPCFFYRRLDVLEPTGTTKSQDESFENINNSRFTMTKVFIAKGGDRSKGSKSIFIVLACIIVLAFVTFVISQSAATTVIFPLDRGSESKHVPSATRSTPVDDGIERVPYALLMANVDRQIAERHAWLSRLHSEGKRFSELKGAAMWYMFQPVMPCLWYMEKVPSAIVLHDGGVRKYLCHMRLPVELFSSYHQLCMFRVPHNFLP
jgi:hypothetical protein